MGQTSSRFVVGIVVFCVIAFVVFICVLLLIYFCYFRKKRLNQKKVPKEDIHTVTYDHPLTVNTDHENRLYGHFNQGYISPVTVEAPSPRSNAGFTFGSGNAQVLDVDYVDTAGQRPRRHSLDLGSDRRAFTLKEGTMMRQHKHKSRDTRSLVGSTHTLLSNGSRVRTGTLVRPVYATSVTTLNRPGKKSKQVMKSNSVLVGFEPVSNRKVALMEDQRLQALSLAGSPRSLSPPGSPGPSRRHYSTKSESALYYTPGIENPDGNIVRWSPSMRRKMDARTRIEHLESVSTANSRRETPLTQRKEYDLGERRYRYTMNGGLQPL